MKLEWFGKKKLGIALGGGVARGLAHIGVLKILKKHQIPIDYITGTSAGSIIASLFAFGLDPNYLESIAVKNVFNFFNVSMNRITPFGQDEVVQLIEREIGRSTFKDVDIPLIVVACDLKTGKRVLLKSGRVSRAVSASCAFPGIFEPKKIGGKLLIDGGAVDNLPVDLLRTMGADYTIAVDVIPSRSLKKDTKNPIKVMGRAIDLVIKELSKGQREAADILIEPEIPTEIWHLDFHKAKQLIKIGEKAANKKISKIKKLL